MGEVRTIQGNAGSSIEIKRISSLYRLGFDIVDGCQMRCIGCPNSIYRNPISFMSMEDFRACLNNFDIDFLQHIRLFNFGEALLHPQLVDLILEIQKFGWWRKTNYLEISTNGQYTDN